ncbi:hypothetical protein ACVOMV_15185 [Mesorhizobium atlanticum]
MKGRSGFLVIEAVERAVRHRRDRRVRAGWPTASGVVLCSAAAPSPSPHSAALPRSFSMAAAVGETVFMVMGFILLGLSFGQSSGVVASSFSRQHRYTGSAVTSDLAWMFGAGFAPLAALLLARHFRPRSPPAPTLLSGAACTLIALWIDSQASTTGR